MDVSLEEDMLPRREIQDALVIELQDAYWQLPSAEYVPHATLPDTLLEDSDRLDASWTATVASLRDEASEDEAARLRIAKEVETFKHRKIGNVAPDGPPADNAKKADGAKRVAILAALSSISGSLRRVAFYKQ